MAIVNLDDFEEAAREKLPAEVYDFVAGGAGDEITLRRNREAFERRTLRPRVLVDVSKIDTTTQIMGAHAATPVGIAPTAQHGLMCDDAEQATARAAAAAGAVYCASTMATCSMEEIADAGAASARWFQLYVQRDRALSRDLVQRAEATGFTAIVLTVDNPTLGNRERDLRAAAPVLPKRYGCLGLDAATQDDLFRYTATLLDPGVTWTDVDWLQQQSALPLAIKGIVTAEDARLAVEHGARAVWVSNHGGRQLDRAPATLDALEEVVEAVDSRADVYIDGGIRRGADVFTALALGATAAFVGRPALFALAANGERDVAKMLAMLNAELALTMALCGVTSIGGITRAYVQ